MTARHTFTLRAYLQQARAAAAVEQAVHAAMLPFAASAVGDELVFDTPEAYERAVAAADKAKRSASLANPLDTPPGGSWKTPPVSKFGSEP